ncbi:acyltransferase [Pseudomonas sp. PDM11]|uniref:acyltransferase n=1 Tax=Pseudomonas sp. PDM11 TaxID=2769309 RepID=UPI00178141BB|nr:acyltransferase [Pseudomonas sp. PDM11]MBD9396397.1 acyltransferase [Pseudomonas sp. PDM11]
MQRLLTLVTLSALISACGQSAPSESEISKTLADSISSKGCATSTLFKSFPIPPSMANSNGAIIRPFEDIGFIAQSADGYQLTEKGQAEYDAERSGFCYTDSYKISDIKVIDEEAERDLPPALSGAWTVSFTVAPASVDEWVKNPEILKAASRASLDKLVEPQSLKVRVAREKGKDELIVADPRFGFSPGIHFNMGW